MGQIFFTSPAVDARIRQFQVVTPEICTARERGRPKRRVGAGQRLPGASLPRGYTFGEPQFLEIRCLLPVRHLHGPSIRLFCMEPAIIRREETVDFEKHGVRMHVYTGEGAPAGIVYQEMESGHAEEFLHEKSAFIYYIIEGEGVYVISGVEHHVGAGDVVVVPPKNSIYFKGRFRQVLVTVPPGGESGERHFRDVGV